MATDYPTRGYHPTTVTARRDGWYWQPLAVVVLLTSFGVYSTWAAFSPHTPHEHSYFYEDAMGSGFLAEYLSPFYSPCLTEECHARTPLPKFFSGGAFSPAVFILWAPLGFRATCYYYRKSYYRSFFLNPPACAVDVKRPAPYKGETAFPFVLQNVHRWFFYAVTVILFFLWVDAVIAFRFTSVTDGARHFGLSPTNLFMLLNVVLLTGYSLGCHSWRHLIGGSADCFTCPNNQASKRYGMWRFSTWFNERHMLWAWLSLVSVGMTDVWIRFISPVWDPRWIL